MRVEEFERRLLDFVNRTLLGSDPALAVDEDTALFEEGIVTSLRILDLIAFVERELQTRVPDEAVRLANFRSVRAIAAAFGGNKLQDEDSPAVLRVFDRRIDSAGLAPPLESPMARGQLAIVPPGRAVLRGSPLRLFHYFDSIARGWAHDLGAEDRSFPRRISSRTLVRAGRSGSPEGSEPIVPPAVCYHVYPAWEGRVLGDRPALLTARGRCFREESGHEPSLERLRDFEMREIVALGTREDVDQFRQELIARVSDFVTRLQLEGRIETASDPFFTADPRGIAQEQPDAVPELRGRQLMQRVLPLKYELRLALDETGRTCAVASFNHHLDFFGRRFGIRLASGAAAHSGCVAFGLERWVLAFLSQYGADERGWPAPVRDTSARGDEYVRIA